MALSTVFALSNVVVFPGNCPVMGCLQISERADGVWFARVASDIQTYAWTALNSDPRDSLPTLEISEVVVKLPREIRKESAGMRTVRGILAREIRTHEKTLARKVENAARAAAAAAKDLADQAEFARVIAENDAFDRMLEARIVARMR